MTPRGLQEACVNVKVRAVQRYGFSVAAKVERARCWSLGARVCTSGGEGGGWRWGAMGRGQGARLSRARWGILAMIKGARVVL